MNHDSAIESQAAERYMLAEMNETERDDFEDHYFDCIVCTDNVQSLEKLRNGVRAVPNEVNAVPEPIQQPVRVWWKPAVALPWAATLLLGASLGYQNVVMLPRMAALIEKMSGVAPAQIAFAPGTRAESESEQQVPADEKVIVSVEIEHNPQLYTSYYATVRDAKGNTVQSYPVTAELTVIPVSVVLRPLPAGHYEMVVEGVRKDGNRSETARYPFVVAQVPEGSSQTSAGSAEKERASCLTISRTTRARWQSAGRSISTVAA